MGMEQFIVILAEGGVWVCDIKWHRPWVAFHPLTGGRVWSKSLVEVVQRKNAFNSC